MVGAETVRRAYAKLADRAADPVRRVAILAKLMLENVEKAVVLSDQDLAHVDVLQRLTTAVAEMGAALERDLTLSKEGPCAANGASGKDTEAAAEGVAVAESAPDGEEAVHVENRSSGSAIPDDTDGVDSGQLSFTPAAIYMERANRILELILDSEARCRDITGFTALKQSVPSELSRNNVSVDKIKRLMDEARLYASKARAKWMFLYECIFLLGRLTGNIPESQE